MELSQPVIAIGSPAVVGPLPQHLEQITEARRRGKLIRRAATIATISGWSLAIFAGLTLLGGLLDARSLLLGAALALSACFEIRGARDLRRLSLAAPKWLARNQIFLGAIIVAYAVLNLYVALYGPSPIANSSDDAQVAQAMGSFDGLARGISAAFYGAIALIGLIVPGLTALYYATRRKHIEEFVRATPAWIVDLNRKGISV